MAGPQSFTAVAVKKFVELQQVLVVLILREARIVTQRRAAAIGVGEEEANEPCRELIGDLPEVQFLARAGGKLDLKAVAEEVVITLQRLDEQVIEREPDRPAPVGVP